MKYYLLFVIISITTIVRSQDLLHGTFIYFAKCKEGIVCVGDSRMTSTSDNDTSYLDDVIKIHRSGNMIFAFANKLTIGDQFIWSYLKSLKSIEGDPKESLKNFYSLILKNKDFQSYIEKGNVFIAGFNKSRKPIILCSMLGKGSLPIISEDRDSWTNHADYSAPLNFSKINYKTVIERIKNEILEYKTKNNNNTIGGKFTVYVIDSNSDILFSENEGGLNWDNMNQYNEYLSLTASPPPVQIYNFQIVSKFEEYPHFENLTHIIGNTGISNEFFDIRSPVTYITPYPIALNSSSNDLLQLSNPFLNLDRYSLKTEIIANNDYFSILPLSNTLISSSQFGNIRSSLMNISVDDKILPKEIQLGNPLILLFSK
ncbi:MAG: hypothetical protein ABI844_08025 [Saprospiraceae bacterium]